MSTERILMPSSLALRDDRRQDLLGFGGDDGHAVVGHIRLEHAGQPAHRGIARRLRVFAFAEVQDERVALAHLVGQFRLGAQRDQLAVVDDADPVGELLGFFHVVGGVEHGHALLVERP